jgi:adenylate cyclase
VENVERKKMTRASLEHRDKYCGIPLVTEAGYALGTLTVMDFTPRQLTFEQTEALRRLSRQVINQLDLRRRWHAFRRSLQSNAAADRAVPGAKSGQVDTADSGRPPPFVTSQRKW